MSAIACRTDRQLVVIEYRTTADIDRAVALHIAQMTSLTSHARSLWLGQSPQPDLELDLALQRSDAQSNARSSARSNAATDGGGIVIPPNNPESDSWQKGDINSDRVTRESSGPDRVNAQPQHAAFNQLGTEHSAIVFDARAGFDCNAFAAITGTLVAGGQLILIVPPLAEWPSAPDTERTRVTVWTPAQTELAADDRQNTPRYSRYLQRLSDALSTLSIATEGSLTGLRCLHTQQVSAAPTISTEKIDEPTAPDTKPIDPNSTHPKPIKHSATRPTVTAPNGTRNHPQLQGDETQTNNEQEALINSLLHHVQHAAHQTFLITGDRGRGKSSALGIMLGRHNPTPNSVILCGPNQASVSVLQHHYRRERMEPSAATNATAAETAADVPTTLAFLPPETVIDHLMQITTAPDDTTGVVHEPKPLIIIDEAARIPLPQLLLIIEHAPCSILSTTVAGYEGAGRGFALQLGNVLARRNIPYKKASLTQPRRWSAHDRLEQFVDALLLLDADIKRHPGLQTDPIDRAEVVAVDQTALIHNEPLLSDIYGLLLQAHYRTTPLDLRHILDGVNLAVWVLTIDEQLLGAALVATEGNITDIDLKQGILQRTRRPRGHVVPQLLAQYTGTAEALDLTVARVVRIAIHPECQRRGLGSFFLNKLHSEHQALGYDATCAMFSAAPDVVRFWEQNGFPVFHTGARPPSSHAYPSVSVMQATSRRAVIIKDLALQLHADKVRFYQSATAGHETPDSHYLDVPILKSYCQATRNFHDSQSAIARLTQRYLKQFTTDTRSPSRAQTLPAFSTQELKLMTLSAAPRQTITTLSKTLEFQSKKQCEQALRQCLSRLLTHYRDVVVC